MGTERGVPRWRCQPEHAILISGGQSKGKKNHKNIKKKGPCKETGGVCLLQSRLGRMNQGALLLFYFLLDHV